MADQLPRNVTNTIKVLHLAMIGSLVMCGVAAYVVSMSQEPQPVAEALVIALIAAGAAVLVASLVVPGMVFTDEHVLAAIRDAESDGSGRNPLVVGAGVMQTEFILRLALTEAVAIFGLVLSFLSAQPLYYAGFGAVALVFMLLVRFDEERLQRLYAKR